MTKPFVFALFVAAELLGVIFITIFGTDDHLLLLIGALLFGASRMVQKLIEL